MINPAQVSISVSYTIHEVSCTVFDSTSPSKREETLLKSSFILEKRKGHKANDTIR